MLYFELAKCQKLKVLFHRDFHHTIIVNLLFHFMTFEHFEMFPPLKSYL